MPSALKNASMRSRKNRPMFLSFTLPEGSRSLASAASKSWPAPSATAMTACDLASNRCFSAARNASSAKGTSG
jgi:hypothetical protein